MPLAKSFLIVVLACNCFILAQSQAITNDTSFLQSSIDSALTLHKTSLGQSLRLYNGTAYNVTYPGAKGFPYFNSESLQKGTVLYDGSFYQDIPLLYDLVNDVVITESYNHQYNIQLLVERVSYFTLAGHRFVHLQQDSVNGASIATGFYDVLYSGKTTALARREKKLQQVAKNDGIDSRFIGYTYYYIYSKDTYHKITGTSSLLDAFADKKNNVRSFLRKNNYRFKKDPENTISKAAAYYDQLSN